MRKLIKEELDKEVKEKIVKKIKLYIIGKLINDKYSIIDVYLFQNKSKNQVLVWLYVPSCQHVGLVDSEVKDIMSPVKYFFGKTKIIWGWDNNKEKYYKKTITPFKQFKLLG